MALLIVPVGLFVIAAALREARGPYYLGANSDPDYAYLLNALNLVEGQTPFHTDHPGTTVQMLGALAIVATSLPSRLLSPGRSIEAAVLSEPEAYLSLISLVLVLLVSLAALIAGLRAVRLWGLVPALALEASLLLFPQIAIALPRVTPEPLLIVAGLVLIATLAPVVASRQTDGLSLPLLVGATMGFGVATKFTFIPVLALVLLFRDWPRRAAVLIATAVAFVVFTLPILPRYRFLVDWIATLATRKGINGSGETGFPEAQSLVGNLSFLISAATPLFVLLAFYVVFLLLLVLTNRGRSVDGETSMRRLLFVSSLVVAGQIAVTAKNPGAHYLIPSMVAVGLTNAAVMAFVLRASFRLSLSAPSRLLAPAALAAGVVFAGGQTYDAGRYAAAYAENSLRFEQEIKAQRATVVTYYRSSLPSYALAFGNDFSAGVHGAELRQLYPDALFYSIWRGVFYSFVGDVQEADVERLVESGRPVLMYGSPFVGDYAPYQGKLVLEPLSVGSDKALYRLVRIDAARLHQRPLHSTDGETAISLFNE